MEVCKESNVIALFLFTITGNNPDPSEFTLQSTSTQAVCMDVSIGPGDYTVVEDDRTPSFDLPIISGDCT